MKKRSVTIHGHKTSLTLEDPFWEEIQTIAGEKGQSVSALLSDIDHARDEHTNLSSAIRLYVLARLQNR